MESLFVSYDYGYIESHLLTDHVVYRICCYQHFTL